MLAGEIRMPLPIQELIDRIRELEEQLELEYARHREAFQRQRIEMADRFLELQRRHRIGVWPYLRGARWSVILTAPVIYLGWPVFALIDAFVSFYQRICFPLYRIPRVKRADYLVFDRSELPYLNPIEKLNCLYCSDANGVIAYAREIAGRTEQYWCPIKHATRLRGAHRHYPDFFEYGDSEAYRQGLERLRQQLTEGAPSTRAEQSDK